MWKSRLKHSTAEFQSIQHFWLQLDIASEPKKRKTKNADMRVWGDVRRDQKPGALRDYLILYPLFEAYY